jgi:fatty-acyl-CoA synthase
VKQDDPGRYHPDALVDLLDREKVSFSHCVPTILQMVLASAKTKRGRSLRLEGGDRRRRSAASTRSAGAGTGGDLFAGYGMSETCPILTLAHLKPHMEARDIERQVEIRCRTGKPAPLVQIRSAVIDNEGYLKITDRIKDVIKTGSEWVSSLDVEDLLLEHPEVVEAAVIGVPDRKWTERPLAIVVVEPESPVSEAEIREHLHDFATRGVISRYGVPDRVVFVDELLKTSVGKLDKKVLSEKYPE